MIRRLSSALFYGDRVTPLALSTPIIKAPQEETLSNIVPRTPVRRVEATWLLGRKPDELPPYYVGRYEHLSTGRDLVETNPHRRAHDVKQDGRRQIERPSDASAVNIASLSASTYVTKHTRPTL